MIGRTQKDIVKKGRTFSFCPFEERPRKVGGIVWIPGRLAGSKVGGSGQVGRCATFQRGGKLLGRTKVDASKTGCMPGMPLSVRIKTDLFVNWSFSLSKLRQPF